MCKSDSSPVRPLGCSLTEFGDFFYGFVRHPARRVRLDGCLEKFPVLREHFATPPDVWLTDHKDEQRSKRN